MRLGQAFRIRSFKESKPASTEHVIAERKLGLSQHQDAQSLHFMTSIFECAFPAYGATSLVLAAQLFLSWLLLLLLLL
jgi:hypothetical protein